MKRGSPLRRITPLANRTPLAPGTSLARSSKPLSRSTPLPRTPLARSEPLAGTSGGLPRTSPSVVLCPPEGVEGRAAREEGGPCSQRIDEVAVMTLVLCACWCGELIKPFGSKGRPRRFAPRHYIAPHLSDAWRRLLDPEDPNDKSCWVWPGSVNNNGYGSTKRNGQNYVHRAAWVQAVGPIPDGLDVCHVCDNPPCFRPSHLFLGTAADNMQDMARKGRWGNQEPPPLDVPALVAAYEGGMPLRRLYKEFSTSIVRARRVLIEQGVRIRTSQRETRTLGSHCRAGHPFDLDNTYVWKKDGTRRCRACNAQRQRGYDAQKRVAS